MLMAHPTVLRNLVARYESLSSHTAPAVDTDGKGAAGRMTVEADPEIHRQLADVSYTLCVSTGTREIGSALAAAREHIASAA
ncbi:DUF5133 domain-containing protein [Streptomyces sp. CA-111067]|uniref:DUF5133 domain-containing protein n=1 Tax=Streptomyces sp. CA-111067 TaxID=3240046 RepID=UPI003D99596E